MTLPRQLRFSDLKARGIVKNWVTLRSWINKRGFPPGRLLSPNCRVWDEASISEWVETRPIARTQPLRGGAKVNVERSRTHAGEVA
jgi:hypothetical protein